jgi:hypothetical protein
VCKIHMNLKLFATFMMFLCLIGLFFFLLLRVDWDFSRK